MPRKASHKCTKMEMWRMEFGVKWCAWIPQWKRRLQNKSEVGIPKPNSIKGIKVTVSLVSSNGRLWPKTGHHLMIDRGWRRCSSTRDKMSYSMHLLANHPSSSDGELLAASFSFPLVLDFLGAMRNVTGRFMCIQWLPLPRIGNKESTREREDVEVEEKARTDLIWWKEKNGGWWGKT